MGLMNTKTRLPGPSQDNTDIIILKQMVEQMEQVVNNQADLLRKTHHRLGEMTFKMGKMDEQIHLNKINIRCEKDKNMVLLHTLVHLGIIETETFSVVQNIIQTKLLPIGPDGHVRASIRLSRYNCSPVMPKPQGDFN